VPEVKQPAKQITADECAALARAMQAPEVKGNLAAAARLLGIKPNRAYKIARADRYLMAMQSCVDPEAVVPTDADSISRGALVPASEADAAREMIRQERLLSARNWQELGISAEQADKLVKLEQFATLPLSHSILVTHGGMMSGYARLTALFDRYADELDKGMLPTEEMCVGGEMVRRDEGDVERAWVKLLVELSAERRAVYGQLQKGRLQIMKARQMAKELRAGKKGQPVSGPPILMQVQPGAHVTMSSPGNSDEQTGS
jgi:hypothetical protein